MVKILVVDDEPRILLLLQNLLQAQGYTVTTARDGNSALDFLRADSYNLIISDLRMAPMDGLALLAESKKVAPHTPFILLTAYASVETAISALKSGAFDYLAKPFKVDEMLATVQRAIDFSQAQTANAVPEVPLQYHFESVIASSPAMTEVCDMIQRVGATTATVLIHGESGTGKEVIAHAIHNVSPRADKPWVAVNCAALPENLLESEMFGHVKGAFTGAVSDKPGLFEIANGGTFLLDEISSMPLILQGKLLRVLQEKEIRRVGGNANIPVDVRVIAASNSNLEQLVAQGAFRADLYYRFAVITIDIPPLRERKEDILPLVRHFIKSEYPEQPLPTLERETAELLTAYTWPGNVRELENAIKHALTFLEGDSITPDLLPPRVVTRAREVLSSKNSHENLVGDSPPSLKNYLKSREKEYLELVMAEAKGDKEKAAQTLQVSLATLYRKLADDVAGGAEEEP